MVPDLSSAQTKIRTCLSDIFLRTSSDHELKMAKTELLLFLYTSFYLLPLPVTMSHITVLPITQALSWVF